MRFFTGIVSLFLFTILSCSPGYYKNITASRVSHTSAAEPDYSLMENWAAHPYKKDPSDSISKAVHDQYRDSSVDVFFLHPTTFTDKDRIGEFNASVADDTLNAKTDYGSILYQASVFNADARIFAPRYRQAHIGIHAQKQWGLNWIGVALPLGKRKLKRKLM